MFILILILIVSIINTVINIVLLYLIIIKNGNVLANNQIGDQNENKGLIFNFQKVTINHSKDKEMIKYINKEKSNKSEPSNYNEFNKY